jgi:endonuclease YncB( thermonuclease family)
MRIGYRLILATALAFVAVSPACAEEEIRGRAKVLSSDTLEVSGKRFRLFGIIGPSKDQKCRAGALPWLCGNAAFNHLREQAEGKLVACVDKGLGDDQKPTALCKAEGKDLGYIQVRNGWANADPKAGGYQTAESAARASKVGFWKGSP